MLVYLTAGLHQVSYEVCVEFSIRNLLLVIISCIAIVICTIYIYIAMYVYQFHKCKMYIYIVRRSIVHLVYLNIWHVILLYNNAVYVYFYCRVT